MKTKLDQQQKPVWLTGGAVIDGQYYAPGEPTPYASESEVPENLRHLIARDESEIPSKPIRNIYDQQPGPEPGEAGIYYQATGSGQWRRQAVRAARGLEEQAWCEAQAEADQQLPAETQEALQDQHDRRIALLKAQGEYAQRLTDATYEPLRRRRKAERSCSTSSADPFSCDARKQNVSQAKLLSQRTRAVNGSSPAPWTQMASRQHNRSSHEIQIAAENSRSFRCHRFDNVRG
jgi:hypothetical protein